MEQFSVEFRIKIMSMFKYFSLILLSAVNELNIMCRSVVFISYAADISHEKRFYIFGHPPHGI